MTTFGVWTVQQLAPFSDPFKSSSPFGMAYRSTHPSEKRQRANK